MQSHFTLKIISTYISLANEEFVFEENVYRFNTLREAQMHIAEHYAAHLEIAARNEGEGCELELTTLSRRYSMPSILAKHKNPITKEMEPVGRSYWQIYDALGQKQACSTAEDVAEIADLAKTVNGAWAMSDDYIDNPVKTTHFVSVKFKDKYDQDTLNEIFVYDADDYFSKPHDDRIVITVSDEDDCLRVITVNDIESIKDWSNNEDYDGPADESEIMDIEIDGEEIEGFQTLGEFWKTLWNANQELNFDTDKVQDHDLD